jgi:hypothetical protein
MSLITLARVLAEPHAGDPPPGFLSGVEQTVVWWALRAAVVLVGMAGASGLTRRPVPAG